VINACFTEAPQELSLRYFQRFFTRHAFEAGHFLALGLLSAGLCGAFLRWGKRPWIGYAGLAALALGLGVLVLPADLVNASARYGAAYGPWVGKAVLFGGVVVPALAVPLACAVGRWLARPWLRWVCVVCSLVVIALNCFLPEGDYPGMHLFAALTAVTLLSAALAGAVLHPRLAPLARRFTLPRLSLPARVLASVGAAIALIVPPPPSVGALLMQSKGSVLPPFIGQFHAQVFARVAVIPAEERPWFEDRSDAPEVPPSGPALLPSNAVVILVSIDSLRADVLLSGKHDDALPTLAALRRRSVYFSNARSPGSQTVYSLSTLFSGKYFSQQYWSTSDEMPRMWPHEDTSPRFPELLKQAGIPTVTFAGAPGLLSAFGVVRGFSEERFIEPTGNQFTTAKPLMDATLRRVTTVRDGSLFLYLHLLDAHAPYNLSSVQGTHFERYIGELSLVDAELGRLVRQLYSLSLGKRAALIVTADHGEAFGEHNHHQHSTTLYEELLRVPLLVHLPGARPREVTEPVSLIDLGPTILDLFGRPTPGSYLGQSLVPFLRGDNPTLHRPIVAEGRLKQALVLPDGMKVIVDNRRHTLEVYDLRQDPAELNNLADEASIVDPPLARLERFFAVHTIKRPGYKVPYRP
jgi:hypothetical protein